MYFINSGDAFGKSEKRLQSTNIGTTGQDLFAFTRKTPPRASLRCPVEKKTKIKGEIPWRKSLSHLHQLSYRLNTHITHHSTFIAGFTTQAIPFICFHDNARLENYYEKQFQKWELFKIAMLMNIKIFITVPNNYEIIVHTIQDVSRLVNVTIHMLIKLKSYIYLFATNIKVFNHSTFNRRQNNVCEQYDNVKTTVLRVLNENQRSQIYGSSRAGDTI
ncbi:Uncharacterized protein FWK35_00018667 [Aphis craccivora]|uniref:Uncharacterized protein n=1 Tax=Aphis craccivora TaxID=307492 RepID=A0A6G0Z5V0_APHCR|nr:Uncharacterized protein FWK35_00018667 [Aphis craccivora]